MKKKIITVGILLLFALSGILLLQDIRERNTEKKEDQVENIKQNMQDKGETQQSPDAELESEDTQDEQPLVSYMVNASGTTLQSRFPAPEGYERITCEAGSFGAFLREYLLLEDGAPVLLYDGSPKACQSDHTAVFAMDMAEGDLQQCADSVLRLYAEYLYRTKQYDRMKFHLTNGFELSFDKWKQGMRVFVNGNKTSWTAAAQDSEGQESFESYLRFLFSYAGTLSMEKECSPSLLTDVQPGDVFLYFGSPGHVVMVLDVCENGDGERAFLLGQGYMPAQQFHVLKNPAHEADPWYYTSEVAYPFQTPEYTFGEGSLMRPDYLQ